MKKFISCILLIALLLTILPTEIINVLAYAEENGTKHSVMHYAEVPDGYVGIYTKSDLDTIRNNLSGNYILMNNIEFSDEDFLEDGQFYNNGDAWKPIGSESGFSGTFDGNGYSIINITLSTWLENEHYVGLFSKLSGTIKNLNISGIMDVTQKIPSAYIGALAGYSDGTILNCSTSFDITVSATLLQTNNLAIYAGGIVGYSEGSIDGCTNNGKITITELLESFTISNNYFGGVCGYAKNTITNCKNIADMTVRVTGSEDAFSNAGGVCGQLDGFVSNSTNFATLNVVGGLGANRLGGIVGNSQSGSKVVSSSNCGNLSGTAYNCYVGGVVSLNSGEVNKCSNISEVLAAGVNHYSGGICSVSTGIVNECYNSGTVLWTIGGGDDFYTGGIVSYLRGGTVTNCYNVGHVAENMWAGNGEGAGIAGRSLSAATISNCYNVGASGQCAGIKTGKAQTNNCYYLEYSALGDVSGALCGTSCTIDEMSQEETFIGFDFETIWSIDPNSSYKFPTLKNNMHKTIQSANFKEFAGGNGSFENPYLIANVEHLKNVANYPRAFFRLIADIDMKNQSWVSNVFMGVFDGAGHSIKNLTNSLFLDNEGCIANLHLEDANIDDSGFVGQFHFGKILNCSFSGNAVGGGIVDDASGPIVNCINYGTINENGMGGGGIAATVSGSSGDAGSWKGKLINCVNFGTINGFRRVGGLAGWSDCGNIINCYNAGNVIGGDSAAAGGIVGLIKQAVVINCYNIGIVSTNSNGTACALIGKHSSGYAENCYYLDNMSSAGPDETITGTMLNYNDISKKSSYVGFDFNSVWTMEGSENYSYPELRHTPIIVDEFAPSYTVVFKNWNGDILNSSIYSYGEQVEAPKNPTHQSEEGYFYSFVGWDKEVVPCSGNAVYTAVYDKREIVITTIAVTKKPTKLTYLEGESFDKSGMVVTAYYNNNTSSVVTDCSVSGYSSTPGTKTITVSYGGQTATFTVTVAAKSLSSITVTTKPSKLTYLEGESFDKSGMVVTAYYNNDTSAVINDYTVSGYTSTPGIKTIIISYEDKTATFEVKVEALKQGWLLADNVWYYYIDNVKQTGWQYIDNHWYYLADNGAMATGWINLGGTWYYLNQSGAMQTGWQYIGNTWYYMNEGGAMTTGWQYIGNTWYYFNQSGAMQTGWLLDGAWYYLNNSGAMVDGWQYISNTWYYFSGGAMQTGWLNLGGTWYYLADGGNMVTGWQYIGSNWYYFHGGGNMATGWLLLGNTWYYLASGGNMLTDWQYIDGNWYYFYNSGAMAANC